MSRGYGKFRMRQLLVCKWKTGNGGWRLVDGGGQLALNPFGGGKTSCHLRPLKCTWNPPNTHNPSIDGGRLSEASEGVFWCCISVVVNYDVVIQERICM